MSIEAEPLEKLRRLCLALPGTTERLSHGEATWFVGDKKVFVTFDNDHHQLGRIAFWCAAPLGAQEALVGSDPIRFSRPTLCRPARLARRPSGHRAGLGRGRKPGQRCLPDGGAEAAGGRARRHGRCRLGPPAMGCPGSSGRPRKRRTSGSQTTPPATWRPMSRTSRNAGTTISRPGTRNCSNCDWGLGCPPDPLAPGGCD